MSERWRFSNPRETDRRGGGGLSSGSFFFQLSKRMDAIGRCGGGGAFNSPAEMIGSWIEAMSPKKKQKTDAGPKG